jgi:hypothetical protein
LHPDTSYCKAVLAVHKGNTLTRSRRVTVLPFHLQRIGYQVDTVKRFHLTRAITVLPCHGVTGADAVSLLKCSSDFCSTPKADIRLRRNI